MFTQLVMPILYTNNIEKTKQFYVEKLGCLVKSDSEKFVELLMGSSSIGINAADKEGKYPGHQAIIIGSNDIKADFEMIKNAKVNIERELHDPGYGLTFIFRDTDNNKIEIVEMQP